MKLTKFKKVMTVILLGVTIFAVGCAGQSGSTPSPTPKPTTPPPTPSTSKPASNNPSSSPSPTPSQSSTPSPAPISKALSWSKPPDMQIDKSKKYTATMDTSEGSFKIELFPQESPLTVNNFVFLSQQGFYNGVIFHRIIKDFMIQTGDPKGTGTGGPGYKFADELPPKHKYEPGIVAMANSGPNTNGSQFFICTGPDAAGLDKYPNYSQFGKVIEGMDVVMKIASVPVVSNGREVSKPKNPPVIKTITITEE
jgi:cyclophilin family peptidyl-prolyl cis-trans isomerase